MGKMLSILAQPEGDAKYQLTRRSSNRKVGFLPTVVAGRQTCPTSCPLYEKGCYALAWPLALHWTRVTEQGDSLEHLVADLERLPDMPWRYGVAGDLPGKGDRIDPVGMRQLVSANGGRRGFTYTHKPPLVGQNLEIIAEANLNGFTVNMSGNSPAHADELASLNAGPVVAIVPRRDDWRTEKTPAGRTIVRCPAEYRDDVTCSSCGAGRPLCARPEREYIVGFTPHGNGRKAAERVAQCS